MDKPSKKLIVLAYYKYFLEQQIVKLNELESNGSLDTLRAHVTHSDLNRLHQLKIINTDIYDKIFRLL